MMLAEATVEDIVEELSNRLSISFILAFKDIPADTQSLHASGEWWELMPLVEDMVSYVGEYIREEIANNYEEIESTEEKEDAEEGEDTDF